MAALTGFSVPVADQQVDDDLQRLARELLPQTRALADAAMVTVLEAVPEVAPFGTDEELTAVRESTEQNIGAILSMLAFGVVPGASEPPLGTLKVLHQTVAAGGDLVTLLRAFRVGHAAVSRLWLEHVGRCMHDPERLHAVIMRSSELQFTYFDGVCERLAARYRQEFPHGGSRGVESRRQLLDRILAGELVETDSAGAILGYDLRMSHVGIVAIGLNSDAKVREALDTLAAAIGTTAMLTQPAGHGGWWAWLGSREPLPSSALDGLKNVSLDGVLAGIGEPHSGPDGFRLTHEEAGDAERLGRMAHRRDGGGIMRHRTVELAGLLCSDGPRARRLSADRLGALAAENPTAGRLRETLRAYLACGRNKADTAKRMHVHQKTVAYRLAQVEELLGYPLPANCAELEAALLINATLDGI